MLKNQNFLFLLFAFISVALLSFFGLLYALARPTFSLAANNTPVTSDAEASFSISVLLFPEERLERDFAQYLTQQKQEQKKQRKIKPLADLIDPELKDNFYSLQQYFPAQFAGWQKIIEEQQIHVGVSNTVAQLGLFILPCTNDGQGEILLSPQAMTYNEDYITAVLYHEISHAEDIYNAPDPLAICECTTKFEFDAEKKTLLFLKSINYFENHPEHYFHPTFDADGNLMEKELYKLILFRYPAAVCQDNLASVYAQ